MAQNKKISLVIDDEVLQKYSDYYFSIHTKAHKIPLPHPYHESINVWIRNTLSAVSR